MIKVKRHKLFIKDLQKSQLSDQHFSKYIVYISMLIQKETLPQEALDHALKGEYLGLREFHISGDVLVIYRVKDNTLMLLRIGSHAQLFG